MTPALAMGNAGGGEALAGQASSNSIGVSHGDEEKYVDSFVMPVSKAKIDDYKKFAEKMAPSQKSMARSST